VGTFSRKGVSHAETNAAGGSGDEDSAIFYQIISFV